MEFEFMTRHGSAALYAATRRNASAADQQHSKSHVCPSAEHHPYGRDRG